MFPVSPFSELSGCSKTVELLAAFSYCLILTIHACHMLLHSLPALSSTLQLALMKMTIDLSPLSSFSQPTGENCSSKQKRKIKGKTKNTKTFRFTMK